MPQYTVTANGKKYDIDSPHALTEDEIMGLLGPLDSGQGSIAATANAAARGFARVASDIPGGIGALTGSETLSSLGQSIEGGVNRAFPVNPALADSIPVQLGSAAGMVGSVLATGGIGGAVGKAMGVAKYGAEALDAINAATHVGTEAAVLTPFALGGAKQGGELADAYGMDPEHRAVMIAAGTGLNLVMGKLGLPAKTAAVEQGLGNLLAKPTFHAAGTIALETGKGLAQNVAQNALIQANAPEGVDVPNLWRGSVNAAIGGAAGGAAFSLINAASGGHGTRLKEQPLKKPATYLHEEPGQLPAFYNRDSSGNWSYPLDGRVGEPDAKNFAMDGMVPLNPYDPGHAALIHNLETKHYNATVADLSKAADAAEAEAAKPLVPPVVTDTVDTPPVADENPAPAIETPSAVEPVAPTPENDTETVNPATPLPAGATAETIPATPENDTLPAAPAVVDPNPIEEPPPGSMPVTEDPSVTGVAMDYIHRDRAAEGLPPIELEHPDHATLWRSAVNAPTGTGQALMDELRANPDKVLTMQEVAQGLHEYASARQQSRALETAVNNAPDETRGDLQAQLRIAKAREIEIGELMRRPGSNMGAAFNALKMLAQEDHTLPSLLSQFRAGLGRPLTMEESHQVFKLHSELEVAQKEMDAHEAGKATAAATEALAAMQADIAKAKNESLAKFSEEVKQPSKPAKPDDGLLQKVIDGYNRAKEAGGGFSQVPIADVARESGVPLSVLHPWIQRESKAGNLQPERGFWAGGLDNPEHVAAAVDIGGEPMMNVSFVHPDKMGPLHRDGQDSAKAFDALNAEAKSKKAPKAGYTGKIPDRLKGSPPDTLDLIGSAGLARPPATGKDAMGNVTGALPEHEGLRALKENDKNAYDQLTSAKGGRNIGDVMDEAKTAGLIPHDASADDFMTQLQADVAARRDGKASEMANDAAMTAAERAALRVSKPFENAKKKSMEAQAALPVSAADKARAFLQKQRESITAKGKNFFSSNSNDPRLSVDLRPGNLPRDASDLPDLTPDEARQRVAALERSMRRDGSLPPGQKIAPHDTGKLLHADGPIGFARALASIFRRRLVVVDGLGEVGKSGVTSSAAPDTVFADAKALSWHATAGHELLHHIELAHKALFDELDDHLRPLLTRMEQAHANYKDYAKGSEAELNVRREVYADFLSDSFHDPKFWDQLATRQPTLFGKLATVVKDWFGKVLTALKIKGWESSQYFTDLLKARGHLADAVAEFAARENGKPASERVFHESETENFFSGKKGDDANASMESAIVGASHIAEGVTDFAHWSAKMVDAFGPGIHDKLYDLFDRSKALAEETRAEFEAHSKAEAHRATPQGVMESIKERMTGENPKLESMDHSDLPTIAKELALAHVKAGENDVFKLNDKVHADITQHLFPEATKEQVGRAWSDYGKVSKPSQDEVKARMADMSRQQKIVLATQAAMRGEPGEKSGPQPRPMSDKARELFNGLKDAMRKMGIKTTGTEQLKTAQDAITSRIKNQIRDLHLEMEGKKALRASRDPVEYTDEMNALEKERSELQKYMNDLTGPSPAGKWNQRIEAAAKASEQNFRRRIARGELENERNPSFEATQRTKDAIAGRDAARADFERLREAAGITAAEELQNLKDALIRGNAKLDERIAGKVTAPGSKPPTDTEVQMLKFERARRLEILRDMAPDKPGMTDEQKSDAAKAAAERQIAKIEDELATGKRGAPKAERVPDAKERALKAELASLREIRDAARNAGKPRRSPEEIALAAYKKRLDKGTAKLQERIDSGDYAPKQRKKLELDKEALAKKGAYESKKTELERLMEGARLAKRSTEQKVMDATVRWRRGFLLSGYHTLEKLTGAAAWRLVLTPIEEGIGSVAKRLPVISDIAKQAPRYGYGLRLSAESAALTDGVIGAIKQFGKIVKTGKSSVDMAYGKRDFHDLDPSISDYAGRLHSALKAPAKMAEFHRSFQQRTEFAIAHGVDVHDPLIQMGIMKDAYLDANRAIFMQDNVVNSVYEMALHGAENSTRFPVAGPRLAAFARIMLPIVKVPTNILGEVAGSYVLGLPRAAWDIVHFMRSGMATMKPEHADAIMRNIEKGALGAAMIAYGYFNSQQVGGFYHKGEKHKPGDPEPGDVKVGGVTISHLLTHTPAFTAMQMGADMHQVAAKMVKGGPGEPKHAKGDTEGAVEAALGLFQTTPFTQDWAAPLRPGPDGEYSRNNFVKGLVPLGISQIASDTDPVKKRQVKTPVDAIKSAIPGLRETLKPAKKQN